MNNPNPLDLQLLAPRLALVFDQQRRAALDDPYPSYAERRHRLLKLKRQLQRYQDLLPVAMAKDFGWRAPTESKLIDLMSPVLEISHTLRKLKGWMKDSRRTPERLFATNSLKVTYQPKGVVGIIVPWNFPLFLAISPLTTALAAGNRAIIKMPRACPATAQALRQMLSEVFDEDLVAVVAGDEPGSREFSKLPFNHIIFTGSPGSGKQIMANASANLTPVTLELGGKSPAVVSRSYPLEDAARRIAHGKAFNCGQVCVAPDYAMVPEESLDAFVAAVETAFLAMHSHTEGSKDYTSIINPAQEANFHALLADAEAKGATIQRCGPACGGRQQPLRIVTGVTEDMRLAQEEIFGPILVVHSYREIDEVVDYIVNRPRPLALYCFGHDSAERKRILRDTHSGGVTINDWGWHASNFDAPFGGVGNSGMGTYHGVEGFRELSHSRTVFKRHRFYPIGLFYPPYGTRVQQSVLRLFLGKGDPAVELKPTNEAQDTMQDTKNELLDDNLNLAQGLEHSAAAHPDKVAIHFADQAITYSQLDASASRIANGLRELGIQAGDKVAFSCPNLPEFPMIFFGIQKAGAVAVPLNVLLKSAEIAYHLKDSDAKAYLCFEGSAELPIGEAGWQSFNAVDSCEHFVMVTADSTRPASIDGVRTLGQMMSSQSDRVQPAQTRGEETAVIIYTSGTTGQPKGAELTHANVVGNVEVCQSLFRFSADDTSLIVLPLFHAFGLMVQMLNTVQAGASMVILPRFEAGAVLGAMQRYGVTLFGGVPTMYIALLNHPNAERDFDLKAIAATLRMSISGGASIPVEVIRQFEARFEVPILEGYGLSETSPVATFNHPDRDRIPGSVGQAIAGIDVRIVDGDGVELPRGERGEVVVRGHNVMKGYYKRAEDTAEAIRDGWFHTGDIGTQDEEGNFYIVDRLKEMIIRGGYNVYPREIEEVLMQHENVVMATVVGIPHDSLGEEIKAYLVTDAGTGDEEEMRAWAKSRMADYKYPRFIEFRETLPMTATGKILKKALKAELAA